MTPFNNELRVGQPAIVINVEHVKNIGYIGSTVMVDELPTLEELRAWLKEHCDPYEFKEPYAFITDRNGSPAAIIQRYLMPIPPLGDVHDDEMMDILMTQPVHS